MRLFLDANVLFSASKSDGAVRRLLKWLWEENHELIVDAFVIEEARRNLGLKNPESLPALDSLVGRMVHVPSATGMTLPAEAAELLPDKDRPVLAAAVRGGCEALVTGDRTHFGAWYGRTFCGVAIHSPSTLAKALLAGALR